MRQRRPENHEEEIVHRRANVEKSALSDFVVHTLQKPKVQLTIVLWLIGLFFMLLAPALVTISPQTQEKFDDMIAEAANGEEYNRIYQEVVKRSAYVDDAKVWFWRFRSPHSEIVKKRQAYLKEKEDELAVLERKKDQQISDAKAMVGLFSQHGMDEARQRFWGAYESGKLFAQRQTFYDMFFQILFSREENVMSLMISFLLKALINFTWGFIGCLFYYMFSLASMVYSYQPDPLSGFAFYFLGFLGAASLVATTLVAMYGMAATTVYVVGKVVIRDRIEAAERQERLNYQQRRQQ